jgi:hypothetical protein
MMLDSVSSHFIKNFTLPQNMDEGLISCFQRRPQRLKESGVESFASQSHRA